MNATTHAEGSGITFPIAYPEILDRMNRIDPIAYGRTRNFTDGAITYLSPYLSRGVISLPQVRDSLVKRGFTAYQSEKLLQELAWREYYQRVWQAKGNELDTDLRQPQPDILHDQLPLALETASTGIAALDEGIRQLAATGYLHNHLRMYLASIACAIGKAHWREPARWMYYHLLDGDWASNACSWQWVAGAFSSKKYYCNQENINRYTHSNQEGTFLDCSYEQLTQLPVPATLVETILPERSTPLPKTPFPVLDPSLPLLLYNSYNLDPLWRNEEPANRVLLLEPSHFKRFAVSGKVMEFILGLSKNIKGLQVYTGEVSDLMQSLPEKGKSCSIISKEHPAFSHYPEQKDARDWMFPELSGYYPSFSKYWKECKTWD